jgi:transcription elongation factor Elf1
MEVSETISCPFCGQSFEIVVDTSIASQRFTTDCEVCCRPFEVSVECEPGQVVSINIEG